MDHHVFRQILPVFPLDLYQSTACRVFSDNFSPLLTEKTDKLIEVYVVKTDGMRYAILSISYGG